MYGVSRHNEKNHRVEKQQKTLQGMHCKARPGAGVQIFMMPGMHVFIENADMQKPVQSVKMESRPNWNENYEKGKVNWI